MFYPKKLITKKVGTYKLDFTAFSNLMNTEIDEALLPHKIAKLSYNYKIANGALSTGIGFEAMTLPKTLTNPNIEREVYMEENDGIKKLWHYRFFNQDTNLPQHMLMFYTADGTIWWALIVHELDPYVYKINSKGVIYPNGIPNAVNYRLDGEDYMIFSSPKDGMWKYRKDYGATQIENGPCITSMCVHYERIFAIIEGERTRLSFSANLDPTNWNEELDEGGFIDMIDDRGKLNKVVSFNDYVYVFRDFGVARVSAYGDQSSFSVSQLFMSSSMIYGESVCVCGQKIMFLARDGIYSFDGYTMTKLQLGIEKLFEGVKNDNCSAVFYNGKYYLALKLNFNDDEQIGCENYSEGYINNALIEIDIKTNEVEIYRGIDICSMLMIDDGNICKLLACFNGEHKQKIGQMTKNGCVFGTPLKKVWKSPKSNMGYPSKLKRIREIFIKSKYDCKIKLSSEKESKTYSINGSNKTERLKTNVSGEQIEVEFVSEGDNAYITCPQIVIEVTA